MRGRLVDIGGRRLHVVQAGPPRARPLVVLEHGAYGCAADWAVVQERLAAHGLRSLAYDRAGMGLSDAGPPPRDGRAANRDLAALMDVLGETAPVLLAGHSMGGLWGRLFVLDHPDRVLGLVLADAVAPEVMGLPGGAAAVRGFGRLLQVVSAGARFGLMVPAAQVTHRFIGLTGEAKQEKRRIQASARHARGSAEEVAEWPATSALVGARPLPPELPVAVVTAGALRGGNPVKRLQEAPARASRAGYVEHVAGSTHSSLLGPRYADAILKAVEHVLQAANLGALPGHQA